MRLFPGSGDAAILAGSENVFVHRVHIFFHFDLLDGLARAAKAAFQSELQVDGLERLARRELHGPEFQVWINEREAVDVPARLAADLADETDFRFFGRAGEAKRQCFVRGEAMTGDDASAMTAEDDCVCLLGEDFAVSIRAEQKDVELFGDASASALTMHGSVSATGSISRPLI